jgi:Fe-S cluster assembly protein SufD
VPVLTSPAFSADAVAALPGPGWLRELRQEAWEHFVAAELPSESEEIWRYSRIDYLDLDKYRPVPPPQSAREVRLADLPSPLRGLVEAVGQAATVVISHNGAESTVLHPQAGLVVGPFLEASWPGGQSPAVGGLAPDVWTFLNAAYAPAPWKAHVAPGTALTAPLVLVHWLDAEGGALFPRLEVELGEGASAEVMEIIASADVHALVVPVTNLRVGRAGRAHFLQVQLLGTKVWQLANVSSRVAQDASLRSMTVALGGDYARVRTDSVLEGPGGESELLAGYFGTGAQMHDLRTVQHHAAPKTRSDLLFKGVLANESHSVYSGLIRVEKGAKGTNAFQTNRNLVLSEGAHADSVPNLEIEDNDVRCSHASAVGPIDEAQLFYLESRGVPAPAAERLIALGFMDEVLDRAPVAGTFSWLHEAVARKLAAAGLGEVVP